jgi:CheY-like chemotaxis protein
LTTTLLAVDDSKTMQKVLEITFGGEDYRVVLAQNAQQALEKLRSERPSVALVDAGLGSDNGYDLCQQLKREAPSVGVIILSSKHQPYDKARGASVGADDFMDKPFDTQQLIDKTGALVRRLAEQPPAAPKPVAAPAPAAAPTPTPAAKAPMVQPRPAVPAPMVHPAASRPHVQTLVGGQHAPSPPAPGAPAVEPAPAAARAATPPAPQVAPAAEVATGNGPLADKLAGLGLTKDQIEGVLALSREIVEQVVWEVVPQLAETMIKEEIRRLTAE